MAVANLRNLIFFKSGNWGVDLQAGSQFGYHLLFVILVAGILAAFLQVLIVVFFFCGSGIDRIPIDFIASIGFSKQTWLRHWTR